MTPILTAQLVALAAVALFPGWIARALSAIVLQTSETSTWFKVFGLVTANVAVWCWILQDAQRLHYGRILARWWASF